MGFSALIGSIYYLCFTSYPINTPMIIWVQDTKRTLIVKSCSESSVRARGKQSFGALLGDASGGGWNLEMKKEEIFNFIQA